MQEDFWVNKNKYQKKNTLKTEGDSVIFEVALLVRL